MEITNGKTERGFSTLSFQDRYGLNCSMQKSSLATEEAIWFGIDDPEPKVCVQGEGWKPFPIPKEVLIHSRMHLTQEQVRDLLPILQHFAETGEVKFVKE